jgi:LuxR family maltose regulon positive regulatory protein
MLLGDQQGARALLHPFGTTPPRGDASWVLDQIEELRALDRSARTVLAGAWPVSSAEIRVLHLLPTHLSLAEIADELYVSRNTTKTHAAAIYRKLGVNCRADAVDRARAVGLLPGADRHPTTAEGWSTT